MIELFQAYPIAFLVSIVLPLITGVIVAWGGYDTLKARSESDRQLERIEKNTDATLKALPDVGKTIDILHRYESTLSQYGNRDQALTAVLQQYQQIKAASGMFERFSGTPNPGEKFALTSEILDLIGKSVPTVQAPPNLPGQPLILGLGSNRFRVLFSVPMRIPPHLEFQSLPLGAQAQVEEVSKFGFTVNFTFPGSEIKSFGFTASAEL